MKLEDEKKLGDDVEEDDHESEASVVYERL